MFVAREVVNADAAVESVADALAAEGKDDDLKEPNIPLPPNPPPPPASPFEGASLTAS